MKNRKREPSKSQPDLPPWMAQSSRHLRQSSAGTEQRGDMGFTKDINELVALLKRSDEAKDEALDVYQFQHEVKHEE